MSIPVCWMNSYGDVRWGNMIALEEQALINKTIVRLDDGGWSSLESCFLTEEQCRKCREKSPRDLKPTLELAADKLEQLAIWLRTNIKETKP